MKRVCSNNTDDPCCWVNGEHCVFLEENTEPERRWTCGLRRELGSWDKVHADPRYLAEVKPVWVEFGVQDCGKFTCNNCALKE